MYIEERSFVEIWMKCFSAHAKTKKREDNKINGGENEITDFFLKTTGYKDMKISLMTYPTELEEVTFN